MKSKTIQEFKETEIGKIPKDWEIKKLNDILSNKLRHGIYKSKEYVDPKGVRILKMGLLDESDRIDHQKMERVLVSDSEINKYRIYEGNVIFARTSMMTGGLGNCGLVMKHTDPIIFDGNLLCAEIDSEIADSTFIFYYFKSKYGQNEIARITGGTQSRSMAGSQLVNVYVILPPKYEQIKFSKILFEFDIKIENLKNQNKILEQIAQIIFKSWFVNFNEVKEFIDSEIGKIPKGWTISKLENLLELTKGVSYKSKELMPSNKALVTLKSIKEGGGYAERGLKSFDGKYNDNQIVHANEIVIAQTTVTQNGKVIGKPAMIQDSKKFDVLIASLDLLIARSKNNEIPNSYLYYLFMTDKFQSHIYGYANGSVVLHLSKDGVPNFQFALPPKKNLEQFDKLVSKIIQKKNWNNNEIENLTKTRDILLPKLMSGEIRV